MSHALPEPGSRPEPRRLGSQGSGGSSGGGLGGSSVRRWLEERYLAFDLRWLGVFRILFGILLSVDLIRRWVVADHFYTNAGVLPNHFSLFRPLGRDVFSIYHAFSTFGQVSIAFGLSLLVFVLFTLGYRTRLFHVLSLLCITSLNARNLLVENGGTVVVNLLCFWTLFLPLGKRLSLDALLHSLRHEKEATPADLNQRSTPDEASQRTYSLVVFALLLQWSLIYFFNVVHKTGRGWMDGSALHWFWHQDRIVTPLGILAREHAPFWFVQALTYGTLVFEGILAGILLVPWQQVWLRRGALLLALGLHGGIALSSRLGPFSYAMMLFFVLPLGSRDWQLLVNLWSRLPGAQRLMRGLYRALASRRGLISERLGLDRCGVPLAGNAEPVGLPEPAPIRTGSRWLAELSHPRGLIREVLVVLGLVMMIHQVLMDNAWARHRLPGVKQPAALLLVMDTLRLYQGWRMFAPEPPYEDGRMVVDARTSAGRSVDPLTGEPPDFDPYTPVGWGHSQLWCDFHLKMYFSNYSAYRQYLREYLKNYHVRTGRDADRVVAFDVWWVNDKSPLPGKLVGEAQPPVKLLSFGTVKDSRAEPWMKGRPPGAEPRRR